MNKDIKRLYRSRDNKVLGGVAGGLAEFFGIDVTVIRLLFVFSGFWAFTGVLIYIVMMVIVPEEPLEIQKEVISKE